MSTANRKYKDSVFVYLFSEDEKAKEDYPETTTLKLSDAFMTKPDSYPLELTVTVFNINTNKGTPVLSRCKTLEEYSLFVEEV